MRSLSVPQGDPQKIKKDTKEYIENAGKNPFPARRDNSWIGNGLESGDWGW